MDMIHELAEKIGRVADAIRYNEQQQTRLVDMIASDQKVLQQLMESNKQLHQDFLQLSDQFLKTYPHVVEAELTGNSLGRVFEDSAESFAESEARTFKHEDAPIEMAQAAIAEQARTMHVGEIQQVMEKTWEAAKAAAYGDACTSGEGMVKAASTGPLVPAPDPFRPLDRGALTGVLPNLSSETICNAVLEHRRVEFYSWLPAAPSDTAIEAAAEVLRPVTDGELSHLMDRFDNSQGDHYQRMRYAVDSLLAVRRGE